MTIYIPLSHLLLHLLLRSMPKEKLIYLLSNNKLQKTSMSANSNPMSSSSSSSSSSSANLNIIVEKNPSQSRLSELNVKCWPKWGCPAGKYQLKYDAEETCYMVRGKVKAYYGKGCSADYVEFGSGDLVTFPKGLSCTWDVSVAVDKFYKFESSSPP